MMLPNAEREFLFAIRRAARFPQERMALVLHLSRLASSRAHHHRIARAILQDAAQRLEGQMFTLHGGDLALLCRLDDTGDDPGRSTDTDPRMLPEVLGRLFRVPPASLVSVWDVRTELAKVTAYAEERITSAGPGAAEPAATEAGGVGAPAAIDAVGALLATTRIGDLMHRQTAVRLMTQGNALQPLFREVTFSIATLQTRIALQDQAARRPAASVTADTYLFRYLATKLDQHLLQGLIKEIGSGSPLDITAATAASTGPALHVNLTLAVVRTEAFTRFIAICRRMAARLGVEVSYVDACAAPHEFLLLRRITSEAGVALVVDGVTPLALVHTRPWHLTSPDARPELYKLDWVPPTAGEAVADQAVIGRALEQLGVERVVLQRAENEAALGWGLSQGIRMFQGRQIEAMLGAGRMLSCDLSGGCTVRQCIERASAIARAGRAGCGNTSLLDSGGPRPLSLQAARA